jgi:FdhE protein
MFLQPYAEALAQRATPRTTKGDLGICPVCSAKPLVGVLRPEGDGGKRSLICSVCATEWPYRRIVCPACNEEGADKLAVYTAEQFKHVRVETCETCRCYLKTIDLTKNGHAVPMVDELATIPLNLWAQEHHYTKLRPNLLGI